ncbi:MAG: hypothetical protein H7A25_22210 [Leptospiraceae bacterium]|nr:hypothetical protein [Leptospiraceae bacterium]MCP5502629.1 hypothetical protein [Leptospiraceae bacterium]
MTDKLDTIAERIYANSFWFIVVLIIIATLGTAIVRTFSGKSDLILVPKEILSFIEHVLWVFAVPVSLRIAGENVKYLAMIRTGKNVEQGDSNAT